MGKIITSILIVCALLTGCVNHCDRLSSWSEFVAGRDTITLDTNYVSIALSCNIDFTMFDTILCLNHRWGSHCKLDGNMAKIVVDNKEVVFVAKDSIIIDW